MNVKLIGLMLILLLATTGCASTAQPLSTEAGAGKHNLSNVERYHATVNANAWHQGIDVRWVNPPDEDDLDEYTDAPKETSNGADTK